jgi:hypothetical protein
MRRSQPEGRPPSLRGSMAFEEHVRNARGPGRGGQPPKPTRWASVSTST